MRINIKASSIFINLFIVIVLFFPVKFFDLYHIAIIIPLLLLGFSSKPKKSFPLYLILTIIIYWIFTSWIRSLITGDLSKDLSEIFRFIPLALLILYKDEFEHIKSPAIKIIIFYLWVNFIICVLQYLYKDSSLITNFFSLVYNSNIHVQESLALNSRALGLSMRPNSNGAICLLLTIFVVFKFNVKNKITLIIKTITILAGLISLLLSQSQTAFLALLVIVFYFIFLFFIKKTFITAFFLSVIIIFCATISVSFNLLNKLEDKENGLYYLSTLFEQGTERSSYKSRIEKRDYMIDTAFKTPSFFIIGWGKDYFGAEITATDNEHLYIALVYGPIIWLALIIVAFLAGFKYTILFLKTSNKNYLFKSSIILSWVIIAIPAAFITYPQALILSALFLNYNDEQ
ncbi:O-antigen ligase family protein [Providencia hangzhouensis]|uniref:O-antigen ligase family protein n=1 Tax=Providencia hangzhouensis TaxID=3031799 RepID=UPI0034DCE699